MNILFMCVANSARSQLAEGLARKILGSAVQVESAGSHPGKVNPYAVQVLREIGIDITRHYSKSYDDLKPSFLLQLNYLITLCAEEVCPQLTSRATKLHWPLPDPVNKEGTEEAQLARFRETRDAIAKKIREFSEENRLSIEE